MNFYSMNVYEIERYIRNNSIEASTLTEVLLEKLKEVTGSYEQLTEVLEDKNLSINPLELEKELAIKEVEYENLQYEYNTLRDEMADLEASL